MRGETNLGSWTWPRGQLDLLLRAVLSPDSDRALAAARLWLDQNDIDAVSFREHRLLAGLAQRFGAQIAGHSSYPRLGGLARHLWARSQVAQREAKDDLSVLAALMPVMLIKGASRIAVDPQFAKGRISHDIDILVHRSDMSRALDALLGSGWHHTEGESRQRLNAALPWARAVNLGRGALGNIDLHQQAYHSVNASQTDEQDLWQRAQILPFLSVPMLVPAASDRAALAIGHGALDAHAHSDWLVDCGIALSLPAFDWSVFANTIAKRGLEAPSAIALGYLSSQIGLPIPSGIVSDLAKVAARRPLRRLAIALQAAPRENLTVPGNAIRGLAKLWRKRASLAGAPELPPRLIRARSRRSVNGVLNEAMLSAAVEPRNVDTLELRLRVGYPAFARRAMFEVNTADRHVVTLTMRNWSPHARVAEGRFSIPLASEFRGKSLVIEARPSKLVRESANPLFKQENEALPFTLSLV